MSKFDALDRVAGSLALGLLALSAAVIFLGSQIGVRVKADFTNANVGPLSPLTFTFSMPVDPEAVEAHLSLDPETAGRIEWSNAKSMQFLPASPLLPDTVYEVRLGSGAIGQNGEPLRNDQSWAFSIRPSLIAFLAFPDEGSEIWVVDRKGNSPRRLFESESRVFDFDASSNGEFIVYSAFNAKKGLDLWFVDRNGTSSRKLLDCGTGRCSTPAISPDNKRVAYTREAPGLTPADSPGAPRIYVLDLASNQARSLFEDSQILGYGPRWSPDGKRISSFDGLQDLIRVVSLETGEQVLLPSIIGTVLSWSPDGNRLAFTDVEDTSSGPRTVINIADFTNGEIENLLGLRDALDFGYGALAWSPVHADQLVIGMRTLPDTPSLGLWLIDIDTIGGTGFASERGVTYQSPRWDLWGKAVLFQHFQLGQAAKPEISFWQSGLDKPRVVAQGLSPRWLP
jgi:dipeptidyl aminopeptidase/acylaminoacyl peptidase